MNRQKNKHTHLTNNNKDVVRLTEKSQIGTENGESGLLSNGEGCPFLIESEFRAAVLRLLLDADISGWVAADLIEKYPLSRIKEVEAASWQGNTRNRAGWIIKALEHGYEFSPPSSTQHWTSIEQLEAAYRKDQRKIEQETDEAFAKLRGRKLSQSCLSSYGDQVLTRIGDS